MRLSNPLTLAGAMLLAVLVLVGPVHGGEAGKNPGGEKSPAGREGERRIAIRLLDPTPAFENEVREQARRADRWTEGWEFPVGGSQDAAIEVRAALLPLPAEVRQDLGALPIEIVDGALRFAGTSYPDPETAFALRLPPASADSPAAPRWLVLGSRPEAVGALLLELLVQSTELRYFGWSEDGADYMIRQADWLRRTGRWRRVEGGWGPNPDGENPTRARRAADGDGRG